MALAADDLARLLAQKLATSLLLPLDEETQPYLVVTAHKHSSSNTQTASRVDSLKETDNPLIWLEDYYPEGYEEVLTSTTVRFDVVTAYSASYSAKMVQHKMYSGDSITDNVNRESPKYSVSAKVSKSSVMSNYSVADTVKILQDAYNLALPVYLHLPDIGSLIDYNSATVSSSGYDINDGSIYGIITNLKFSRDSKIQDGFDITFDIEQPKFAKRIDSVGSSELPADAVDSDLAAEQAYKNALSNNVGECWQMYNTVIHLRQNNTFSRDDFYEKISNQHASLDGAGESAGTCPVAKIMSYYDNAVSNGVISGG